MTVTRVACACGLSWLLAVSTSAAQSAAPVCAVTGTITAAGVPLPGVALTADDEAQHRVDAGSTAPDGSYALKIPGPGRYEVKADLVGFASIDRTLTIDEANCQPRVDFVMTLASRVPASAAAARPSDGAAQRPAARVMRQGSGAGGPGSTRAAGGRRSGGPQQFQGLSLLADPAAIDSGGDAGGGDSTDTAAQPLLPPGFSADTAAESVTAIGNARAAEPFAFGDRFDGGRFGDGGPGGPGRAFAGGPGGPGGFAPGPGALAGRPMIVRGMNRDRIRGSIFQSFDSSALDASPFSLNGQATVKPDYLQQRFGATMGGPIEIPKLWSRAQTFFFFNYTGNHSRNPYDTYSTVPTLAERGGDFSALAQTLIDPATHQPFAGNQIPAGRQDPAALSLLGLIPAPNQSGTRQNFHFTTTTTNQVDDINLRVVHNFGQAPPAGRRVAMGPGGPRSISGPAGDFKNLNIGIHYRHSETTDPTAFPTLSGTSSVHAWDVPANYSFTTHGIVSTIRFQYNRQRSDTTNAFAFANDVAGAAGLLGVSADPFDWGAPNLAFSSLASLRDISPAMRLDRTVSTGGQMLKTHGNQIFRWGGDFRGMRSDSRNDPNARGSYVFTGLYTGLDFADFLLGLPQQATVQFGSGVEQFRSRAWDLYLQDDWRASSSVTVNAGVRYEYVSPFAEADNHLANLDVTPGFTAAVPVTAGSIGPFTGAVPSTIVYPDRNNIAPRVGIAWRPSSGTVVRTGYGINYSTGVYQTIAQQLANQPPFAVTNTVLATATEPVGLQEALALAPTASTTNSYGVDPNYRLGSVQIWNVDLQRDLTRTVQVGVGYIGTKGSNLDILRAPNRGPDGLRIPDVLPFLWESSQGRSLMNALTLRLRKRLSDGIGAGITYTLSKAMDDASSIGGGTQVVAQNDQDLAAEWGLSSFDQRHRLSGDFTWELPFGSDRRWARSGLTAALLGHWAWNANVQLASGTPFTARVLGNVADVGRGTNGTLRADYNGAPIAIADPTTAMFFNTAAFAVPAPGTFGDAARNTIIGPGTSNVNLGLTRNVLFGQTRVVSVQVMAANVFNTAQYSAIDTVVNSPTFGQVIAARAPRRLQVITRFRF